jgi:hypothetical protein
MADVAQVMVDQNARPLCRTAVKAQWVVRNNVGAQERTENVFNFA